MRQEINSQLKEQSIAYKDKSEKYENTIKNLNEEHNFSFFLNVKTSSLTFSIRCLLYLKKSKNSSILHKH